MLQLSKQDKQRVLDAIKNGNIDSADLAFPNLIDTIISHMGNIGITEPLALCIDDRRADNHHIPFYILLLLAVAAKLKQKTSLTDVPFAITDPELLTNLGWNVYDTDRPLEQGLFSEHVMRNLLSKYNADEWISFYNTYVQSYVFPKCNFSPNIHILDCTKIPVNLSNAKYENSDVVKIDGERIRGYKLGVLRGLLDTSGAAEEICFGSIKIHDMELCRELLKTTKCFQEGDILLNDRGFMSRNMTNFLKIERKVDTFIPAKKSMTIYEDAIAIAKKEGKWTKHPNRKRTTQKIQLVTDLGCLWTGDDNQYEDVPINACVVHDTKKDQYYVFMTTDTTLTAKQIIQIYEIRPEIEEDFRQMKDFWKLEDFKSTQYNYIVFHIVMTLIGYLYFQVFKNTEEGAKFARKSLPVVVKNFTTKKAKSVVIYVGQYFGIFGFLEFVQLYANCTPEVRLRLDPILALV